MPRFTESAAARVCRYLANKQLTVPEMHVMMTLGDSHLPKPRLIQRASTAAARWHAPWSALHSDIVEAVSRLSSRTFIKEIDEVSLNEIRRVVLAAKLQFPAAMGIPTVGEIDFSKDGAIIYEELQQTLCNSSLPSTLAVRVDESPTTAVIIGHDVAAVLDFVRNYVDDKAIDSCTIPFRVGSWAERWWRIHDRGWCVRVEFNEP